MEIRTMRPFLLLVLFLACFAGAQNFSSYVPACAPPCVEQTLNSTQLCTGINDNACLCTNFPQITFSSRICFVQTCNIADIGELRSEITSGWQRFCNDVGTPLSSGSPGPGWNPGGPESPVPSPSTTAASSTPPTSSSAASSDTVSPPATSSGLSAGAKAGIGVGAAVGGLAVIGGLVFLGFRLGRQRRRNAGAGDTGDTPRPNGGGGDEATGGDGGDLAYKLHKEEPAAPAELPSQDVEPPAHVARELLVTERPVELWHGDMPQELSADAELIFLLGSTQKRLDREARSRLTV
ncbi:hypothetical protein F4802DRAFT_599823 [Xylaria palmicola]|nr:hypothetical protein F4802DRAFT_599823 [Xylaria palmicola]